jgi:hypothetical protein
MPITTPGQEMELALTSLLRKPLNVLATLVYSTQVKELSGLIPSFTPAMLMPLQAPVY